MAGGRPMSFRALVVPEDPINNGYILKPLVERILAECGKPSASVIVLTNPRTSGYEHAKALLRDEIPASGYEHAKALLRDEIPERWGYMDLLLFLPDADGKDRAGEFTALEEHARNINVRLL